MKFLKIAALISLINLLFFAGFLFVVKMQNTSSVPATKSETVKNIATTTENLPVETAPPSIPNKNPALEPVAPVVSNRCIITVEGQKYDVTDFRSLHSGGDIFVCGTDMTSTFFGQHNMKILLGTVMQNMKVQ